MAIKPTVNILHDYYAGGFPLPGRHTVQTSSDYDANGNRVYRYGYQGSEKDFEITNVTGAHITTYFREFDTRLNRTWSIDPVFQPWQSPYSSMDNNPIWFNDPMGDCPTCPENGEKGATHEWGGSTFTSDGNGNWATDMPGIVVVGGDGSDGSWSSETDEFAYGGTLEQYKAEYGVSGSREDIQAVWDDLFKDKFESYKSAEIQKARDKAVIDKLTLFTAPFKASEELAYTYSIYATMGTSGGITGIAPKSFNYTPRGMVETVYRNFGASELTALQANGFKFQIGSNFGSKQFWLEEQGLNWFRSSNMGEAYTATIKVESSALRYGYRFSDIGKYRAISYDSQSMLNTFNRGIKNIKIE